MTDLEKRDYLIRLFETYRNVLTSNQQQYFESYYLFDMSLQEIADNYNISRNAVYDQIKNTIKNLENYEEKLHLLKLKEIVLENEDKFDLKTKKEIENLL